MTTPMRHRRADDGATAIFVALLAAVLFTVAAMSVDLGDAWARKRDVQTQVDVSALSTAHLLPRTTLNEGLISAEVAKYLNKESNQVQGQDDVTPADLLDGDEENGEITFNGAGTRMRVVAPAAWVDFGLGRSVADGVGVAARASVEVMSPLPPMQDVVPFWLPSGCAYGPSIVDTGSHGPANGTVSCGAHQVGNFGQLDSPRKDETRHQHAFALNIAIGLDHVIVPFPDAPSDTCGNQDGDVSGARLDNVSADGRNCIEADTGNDGPYMTRGFVTGVDSVPGRLDVRNGATNPACNRSDLTISGETINNDVLSCFLRGGYTLGSIAQDSGVTEAMLDPAVVDSPRFVWLPVVFATSRSEKAFQPIKTFVPGFITDESATSGRGSSDATSDNGVEFSGQLESLQVFLFNEDALPLDERSKTVSYNPDMRKIVRLVD